MITILRARVVGGAWVADEGWFTGRRGDERGLPRGSCGRSMTMGLPSSRETNLSGKQLSENLHEGGR